MNDDVQAHMGKARQRLKEACTLLQEKLPSGAVNRSYYAMYEAACAMLALQRVQVGSHEGAKIKFGELFVKTGQVEPRFGRDLSEALKVRKDADYSIDAKSEVSLEIAMDEFTKAEEFVAMAENFLKTHG